MTNTTTGHPQSLHVERTTRTRTGVELVTADPETGADAGAIHLSDAEIEQIRRATGWSFPKRWRSEDRSWRADVRW